MKSNDKAQDRSRRQFLGWSLLLGAGVLMPPVSANAQENVPEKVRLISADGQVVVVEKKRLPNVDRQQPVSDQELKLWLDEESC